MNLTNPYHRILWIGINEAVKERKANLITFWGESYKYKYYHLYQGNTIYKMMTRHNLDGLIINSGTIRNFSRSQKEFSDFFRTFSGLPVVSLNVRVNGLHNIVVDNRAGFRKAVEHLVADHGYRKFAFIHGPAKNPEAIQRYRIYQSVLKKYGIRENPAMLYYGDFSRFIIKVRDIAADIMAHLKDIDAIVSSNDDMLLGLIRELKAYGIRIPDDVAATGFDNVSESSFSSPPLTTVNQPFFRQAKTAVNLLFDILDGKEVPDTVTLPTELIIRNSCGCNADTPGEPGPGNIAGKKTSRHTGSVHHGNRDIVAHLLDTISRNNIHLNSEQEKIVSNNIRELIGIFERSDQAALAGKMNGIIETCSASNIDLSIWPDILSILGKTYAAEPGLSIQLEDVYFVLADRINFRKSVRENEIRELILNVSRSIQEVSANIGFDYLLGRLDEELRKLGIRDFYFVFYPQPIRYSIDTDWEYPENLALHLFLDDDKKESHSNKVIFPSKYVIPKNFLKRRFNLIATPLYFMENQMGYVLFGADVEKDFIYALLFSLISNLLYSAILYRERINAENQLQEALDELRKYNSRLKEISEKDELTGLYNRRGFIGLAGERLEKSLQDSQAIILFYIDIDGLKRINDDYGHEEGDFAIRACSDILKKTFRSFDIIGRIGGDEFVVLTSNLDVAFAQKVHARLENNIDQFNRDTSMPYTLSMSAGWVHSMKGKRKSLDVLFKEADTMMYRIKKKKRS